jgi:hypothetical protein
MTTLHVTNMCNALINFKPPRNSMSGIGNAQTCAQGRRTVRIQTETDNGQHNLNLKDVLYIPTNPQNLLSLGRWDKASRTYHRGHAKLTMVTRDGKTVAQGAQISNHLYRLDRLTVL